MALINNYNYTQFGFSENQNRELCELASKKTGLTLFAGIAGCGKSYTASKFAENVRQNNQDGIKAVSVEDPPEYPIPYATAVPVPSDNTDGRAYSRAIKSAMTGEPDVLFTSEVKDSLVADYILGSVLSGIIVLSSIISSSPFLAFNRFKKMATKDMGDDTLLINGIVYQSLIKKTCTKCSKMVTAKAVPEEYAEVFDRLESKGLSAIRVRNKKGCFSCYEGTESRTVAAEILTITPEIYKALMAGDSLKARELFLSGGGKTIQDHALEKVILGEVDPSDAEKKVGHLG
jgi:type II secretory ATPase GspE/PulE/Tfp pilus assembly ATPase PilB-like protein